MSRNRSGSMVITPELKKVILRLCTGGSLTGFWGAYGESGVSLYYVKSAMAGESVAEVVIDALIFAKDRAVTEIVRDVDIIFDWSSVLCYKDGCFGLKE